MILKYVQIKSTLFYKVRKYNLITLRLYILRFVFQCHLFRFVTFVITFGTVDHLFVFLN